MVVQMAAAVALLLLASGAVIAATATATQSRTAKGKVVEEQPEEDTDLLFDLPIPEAIAAAARAHTAPASFFFEAGANSTEKDDAFGAVYFFTAATHAAPDRARTWHHLAFSLGRLAEGYRRAGPETRIVVLCEALRAAQLADAMGGSRPSVQGDLLDALEEVHEDILGDEDDTYHDGIQHKMKPSDLCLRVPGGIAHDRLTAALDLEDRGLHLRAVSGLCTSPEALIVRPTEPEMRRGMLTASTARLVWGYLRVCGVIRLKNVIPQQLVRSVQDAVAMDWESHRETVKHVSKSRSSIYFESENAATRGDVNRFEVKLPPREPFTHQNLTAGMTIMTTVHMLLGGEDVELDTFSYVQSLPSAKMQDWHRDVEALHRRSCDGDDIFAVGHGSGGKHPSSFEWTPAHGFVAIVPLVNVTDINGPTEFLAGSHVPAVASESFWEDLQMETENDKQQCISQENCSDKPSELSFVAHQGDIVLFDLRLRHRGTPNRDQSARPVMYVSYTREWFQDRTNFKAPQTRSWDELADKPHMKRLFSRVDALSYTKRLEDLIKDTLGESRGESAIAGLRSAAQYMQRGL